MTPQLSVSLAYGDGHLVVSLPVARTTVVLPQSRECAPDPLAELRRALTRPVAGPPLRDRLRAGATVAISICDATRPQPRELMLRAILEQFEGIIRTEDIVVLVATGTHRGNTQGEIVQMLGAELADTLRVVNHDARDTSSLRWMGTYGEGVPVWLNGEWVEADTRITTGFVEPHFFAGFSGGPKLVAPGLAGLETVLTLHDARRIGHPNATWAVCESNPVHDDVRAIAAGTGVDFALDVVLNDDKMIVSAFGGDILDMHQAARELVRSIAMAPVDGLFDVVVTSNSGFPLDQNLYQAVKGMSAAATIVKPGGTIICVAECRDGFPDHGSFREVLASESSPAESLAAITSRAETVPDQWQVQILARVLERAHVVVYSDHMSAADLESAHLGHTQDVEATVLAALDDAGPGARVCVLPEGPQTIAYVA